MSEAIDITGLETWGVKFLFPLPWIALMVPPMVFGVEPVSRAVAPHLPILATFAIWTVIPVAVLVSLFLSARLKALRMVGSALHLRGVVVQAVVPIDEIEEIEVVDWFKYNGRNPVRIDFEIPNEFGFSVYVLPASGEARDALFEAWTRRFPDRARAPHLSRGPTRARK